MVTQFIAAFDDIVIGRYNKDREEKDKVSVRYVYAPKQRVLHDIINENKTITLPAVAVNITGVSRDTTRVFNKLDGFYYSGTSGEERTSKHIKAPVPININISMSVLTRYQTDMDQILSNFIPFSNPYVVISWKVPEKFNLSVEQEIRSEVLWDGNVSLNYPTELNASQKARITADTNFTIKGWLFKDEDDPVGNIFYIDQNFYDNSIITEYESMTGLQTLSSIEGSYNPALSGNTRVESFELSGSPTITDIYYNSVKLFNDVSTLSLAQPSATEALLNGVDGSVLLNGTSFSDVEGVLLSTNHEFLYTSFSEITGFTRQDSISGQSIPFTIVNDNTISLKLPRLNNEFELDPNQLGVGFGSGDFSTVKLLSTATGNINLEPEKFTVDISGPFGRIRGGGGDLESPSNTNLNVTSTSGLSVTYFHDAWSVSHTYPLSAHQRVVVRHANTNPSVSNIRFIPYNKAGYSFSDTTLTTNTFSGNTTFIKVTS